MTDDYTDNGSAEQRRGRRGADEFFIQGMAFGKTVTAAAKEAGISERTAYRRLQDPEVKEQVRDMRSRLTEIALDRLTRSADPATQTLFQLLGAESDHVKLGAVRTILDKMVSVRNHCELESRLFESELARAEKPAGTVDRYWPDELEKGPPCVDGMHLPDGYRHVANWLDFCIHKGGLGEEKVLELKAQVAQLREAASHYDDKPQMEEGSCEQKDAQSAEGGQEV